MKHSVSHGLMFTVFKVLSGAFPITYIIELVTHKLHTLNINTQKVTTVTGKKLFSKEKYTVQNGGKHYAR